MSTLAVPDTRIPFARLSSYSNNWVSWILRAGAELKGKGVYLYAMGKVPQIFEPVPAVIDEPNNPSDPSQQSTHTLALTNESLRFDREQLRFIEWQTKDDLASSIIIKLIDETQDTHIDGATTSHELWTRLEKAHVGTSSGVTAFYLKVGILQRKYVDGEPMQAHISSFMNDNSRLRAAKDHFDDKFMAQLLLFSLPQSTNWEMLTVALLQNMSPDKPISITDITARLLQESARIEGGHTAAMSAKTSSSSSRPPKTPGSRSSGPAREKCGYCKIEGHTTEQCNRKKREDAIRAEERGKMKGNQKKGHKKATAAAASTTTRTPDSDDESSSDSDNGAVHANFTRERVFISALLTNESPKHAYIDSGASRHISPRLSMFDPTTTRTLSPPIAISTADGNIIYAKTEGTLLFDLKYNGKVERGRFERALHAPDLATTLISVSQLTRNGIDVNFSGDYCNILDKKKHVVAQAHHTRSSLYRLTGRPVMITTTAKETAVIASSTRIDINLLHQCLGHLGHQNVQRIVRDKLVTGINVVEGPNEKHDRSWN